VVYTVETFERIPEVVSYPLMAWEINADDNTTSLAVIGLNEPGVDVKTKNRERGRKILFIKEQSDQAEGVLEKDFIFKD